MAPQRVDEAPARRPAQPIPHGAPCIFCEIKWVKAKGRSEFHAVASTPDGGDTLIARSPSFRWRLPLSPDATPSAVAAHEALIRQLQIAGWQRYEPAKVTKWYADRYRALADAPSEVPVATPIQICEIRWVKAKGRSEFHAVAPAPDGSSMLIGRSPSFRWRLPVSPDATPAAAAAHEALISQLLAAGWQELERGGLVHWYGGRFRSPDPPLGDQDRKSDA